MEGMRDMEGLAHADISVHRIQHSAPSGDLCLRRRYGTHRRGLLSVQSVIADSSNAVKGDAPCLFDLSSEGSTDGHCRIRQGQMWQTGGLHRTSFATLLSLRTA